MGLFKKLRSDIQNYNYQNTKEEPVISAHYFSAYKKTFVLKMPIGSYGASFGILFIGTKVRSIETVKHEYGHKLQLKEKGWFSYVFRIAIPSLTANLLSRMGRLPYDYYGSVWEREADQLGEVNRQKDGQPWPVDFYRSYKDLLRLFFKH